MYRGSKSSNESTASIFLTKEKSWIIDIQLIVSAAEDGSVRTYRGSKSANESTASIFLTNEKSWIIYIHLLVSAAEDGSVRAPSGSEDAPVLCGHHLHQVLVEASPNRFESVWILKTHSLSLHNFQKWGKPRYFFLPALAWFYLLLHRESFM